ncbi:MAG: antitoxin, Phd family protein [Zetaproteobacteria bacterium CG_4_9_14_3_um_filter_49_83]|nr:MAG: hypothetical protein AUJ56_08230 [Zetaproteobacteria bacterium CG1_02_49_23]PIQ34088.1 MAG: antitoxin, Phd family protein [Zetaproteobacteria bacterium CG17_big_fil_post_rev_8_21_14_2_50_50_13]PIV30235.1 MAG: antitoxin, Phd family protein [Zetaproteobacteria bacterium CG02_land_8_20_14_3_00_50_9]PIY55864.1 MAG: antitoxin, Phd family protein [Zetaproteobacteria bacterium CG_4_10_14_0_8_um_filter_49_80]PJA34994.1 MAG: antitoxin, Phd family protein [Zetaproteobacteria bacterium CG_4_9_14_3
MKMSTQVRSISYLKAHAADVVRDLNEVREPKIITQNGEAKLVVQDIYSYEKTMETMALGNSQIEEGHVTSAANVIRSIRETKQGGL